MPRYSVKLKRTVDSFRLGYEVDAADQAAAETMADDMAAAGGGGFDAPEVALVGSGEGLTQAVADLLYEPIGTVTTHSAVHAPSNAQKNSDITKAEIEAKLTGEISSHTHAGGGGLTLQQVYDALFPVGALWFTESSDNPATKFGGTWVRIQGRFIVGTSDSDTDFDLGDEGGAKTHTLTEAEIPSHTHVQNAHSHTYASQTATTGGVSSYEHGAIDTSSTAAESSISTNAATATNQNTGGGGAHNNLPPFHASHIWKRTA